MISTFKIALPIALGLSLSFSDCPSASAEEGTENKTAPSEIPAATSGVMELTEVKPSTTINLTASKSRTFKLKNKIKRITVSDPAIAEAIVVSQKEFVLIGKSPGTCTLTIWDDAGGFTQMKMTM